MSCCGNVVSWYPRVDAAWWSCMFSRIYISCSLSLSPSASVPPSALFPWGLLIRFFCTGRPTCLSAPLHAHPLLRFALFGAYLSAFPGACISFVLPLVYLLFLSFFLLVWVSDHFCLTSCFVLLFNLGVRHSAWLPSSSSEFMLSCPVVCFPPPCYPTFLIAFPLPCSPAPLLAFLLLCLPMVLLAILPVRLPLCLLSCLLGCLYPCLWGSHSHQ